MDSARRDRLVLVDAYAQIYRAFYAIRGLTNDRGEPTNALFGMARFLLQLDEAFPSDWGAVTFDKGKAEERVQILPEYKANRPPMPEDLRAQVPAIQEWMTAAGWPLVIHEGWEADDLIALAVRERGDRPVVIVSGDKDLTQLVTDDVQLALPGGKASFAMLDADGVREKFGVPPEAMVDYLSLVGDSSDNIPGVQGVGAKTAASLLQEFGSIDSLLRQVEAVPRKAVRESLKAAGPLLERNRMLVSPRTGTPDQWAGVGMMKRGEVDWDRLLDMARANQFKSLVSALEKARDRDRTPRLF
jgi:DNA polymerase-1